MTLVRRPMARSHPPPAQRAEDPLARPSLPPPKPSSPLCPPPPRWRVQAISHSSPPLPLPPTPSILALTQNLTHTLNPNPSPVSNPKPNTNPNLPHPPPTHPGDSLRPAASVTGGDSGGGEQEGGGAPGRLCRRIRGRDGGCETRQALDVRGASVRAGGLGAGRGRDVYTILNLVRCVEALSWMLEP